MQKKNGSRWLAAVLVLTLLLSLLPAALAAEGSGDEGGGTTPVAVTGVSLDQSSLNLELGVSETATLTATVEPNDAANQNVTWSSSAESVATVSNGTVTAVSAGTAKITVTTVDGGKTADCSVEVKAKEPEPPVSVTGVTLDKSAITIKVGASETLAATVAPDNAADKTVTWSSGDATIASVENGKVTGVKVGTTSVTVTTADGGKTAQCAVTVEAVAEVPSVTLSKSALSIGVGGTGTLTATTAPSQNVKWTSSNTAAATVDATGASVTVRVPATAKVGDTSVITATVESGGNPHTAACTVTVTDMSLALNQTTLSLNKGKTYSLSVTGIPSGASASVAWKSSDTYVVTVSGSAAATTLTGKSTGRAIVTATPTVNGKTYAALSCTVTVGNGSVADVTYTTSANTAVTFKADSFNTAVSDATGYSLNYVKFTLPATNRGVLCYDYDTSNGDYDSKVSTSTAYYRNSKSYLSYVTFVPKSDYTGTVTIPYTAVDTGSNTVTGQVVITVTQTAAQVSYTTAVNTNVSFDVSDFNSACKEVSGYNLDYVKFTLPSSSRGVLYLNYDQSGEKKVSSSTSYYRSESPYLSDITFVPAKNYTGNVTIEFTGRDSNKNSLSGTVKIAVGKDGGDVSYTINAGQSVTFNDSDFNDYCKDETGYNLDYVNFTLPKSSTGALYYKYNAKDGTYDKKVVASTNYYRSGSLYLEYVTFVPADGYSGTAKISFTGRDTDKQSISGTVVIKVVAHSDPDTIRYTTGIAPVQFQSSDFSKAYNGSSGVQMSSVKLTLPDASYGKLYYDYRGPSNYGGLVSAGTSYSLTGSNAVSRVSFVPKYGFQGTVPITYTCVDSTGYECKGQVQITVAVPTASAHFTDMGRYGWAAASADYLYDSGITTGVGGAQYSPASLMTRGDFVLMLYRAFNLPKSSGYSFDDVPTNSYYAEAIASAKTLGIAQGSGGRFNPQGPLTRQDAMVLLHRTLSAVGRGVGEGQSYVLTKFSDGASVASYAQNPVAALVQAGVIQGDEGGKLNPAGSLTRAEMAVILHRVLTL